jgi:hypothetical protein
MASPLSGADSSYTFTTGRNEGVEKRGGMAVMPHSEEGRTQDVAASAIAAGRASADAPPLALTAKESQTRMNAARASVYYLMETDGAKQARVQGFEALMTFLEENLTNEPNQDEIQTILGDLRQLEDFSIVYSSIADKPKQSIPLEKPKRLVSSLYNTCPSMTAVIVLVCGVMLAMLNRDQNAPSTSLFL